MNIDYLNKNDYPCIDLLKFIFSIFVVLIHVNPLDDYLEIKLCYIIRHYFKNGLCRVAVPFFFVCTGFLLFKRIKWESKDDEVIKDYIKKLFKLLGIWYFLSYFLNKVVLWYIVAVITSLLVILILRKLKISFKISFIMSFILYVIGIIFESYYYLVINMINNNFICRGIIYVYEYFSYTTANGFFYGLFFVMLGILFSRREIKIKKSSFIIGFVLSFLLLFAEVYIVTSMQQARDYFMYLSLIPVLSFIFYFAVNSTIKKQLKNLRVYSTIIFFSHFSIYEILIFMNSLISKLLSISFNSVFYTIFCLIISLLLAVFIEKKSNEYGWICNLYS